MKITVDLSERASAALRRVAARYGVTQKSVIEAALIVYDDNNQKPVLKQLQAKTPGAKLRLIRAILDGTLVDE